LITGTDPNKFSSSFNGLLYDPGAIRLFVVTSSGQVTVFVDDPSDLRIGAIGFSYFIHPHCRGSNEICPPAIMAILFDAKIFPLS
jgi:hypothetical protein